MCPVSVSFSNLLYAMYLAIISTINNYYNLTYAAVYSTSAVLVAHQLPSHKQRVTGSIPEGGTQNLLLIFTVAFPKIVIEMLPA